jgi:predicted transcriptional regulator
MAPTPKLPRPTNAELDILSALWECGPCTVRDVHTTLSEVRDVGYTTVLKLLQIMTDKGLVVRDESQRSHVYRAKQRETTTQKQLVRDLVKRAFGGSTEKLVMQALSSQKASAEELAEIRRMLDELDGGEA